MNLPNFRLSRPSFTPRFFIYFLFGLILLVLLVEGGYYVWLKNKEVTFPKSEEQIQPQATNEVITEWINLIEGEISEIRERTLVITVVNDFGSPFFIPEEVEVEVTGEAVAIVVTEQLEERPILFTDLKIGDRIQAGELTRLAESKFEAKRIVVNKMKR